MDEPQIGNVVREAIDVATKTKGWSRAELSRRIGVSIATIHRWHSGAAYRYSLAELAGIFKHAGLSLDERLGIQTADESSLALEEQIASLSAEVAHLKELVSAVKSQLDELKPASHLVQLLLAAAKTMDRDAVPEIDELLALRSAASREQDALVKAQDEAISLGEKLASKANKEEPASGTKDEQSA